VNVRPPSQSSPPSSGSRGSSGILRRSSDQRRNSTVGKPVLRKHPLPPGLAVVVFSASPTRICFFNASSFHCTWARSRATPPAPPCTWRRSQRRAAKRHQRGLRTLHRSGPVPQGRRDRVHAQTPRHPQRPGPRQHAPKRKNRPKPHLNALTSNTVVSRATRHLGLVVVGVGGVGGRWEGVGRR